MAVDKSEILQGTLDLMDLKTLEAMGPLHGFGIARRIERLSDGALLVNQGTIYLCLVRLVQKRWTRTGRKQLVAEAENGERMSGVIGRMLQLSPRS